MNKSNTSSSMWFIGSTTILERIMRFDFSIDVGFLYGEERQGPHKLKYDLSKFIPTFKCSQIILLHNRGIKVIPLWYDIPLFIL